MKTEHLRRRFLRNPIFAVWVALSILIVSSGVPFGFSDEGVKAQTTTVNFLNNLIVPGNGMAPHPIAGNEPTDLQMPTTVKDADRQVSQAFTTGSGTDVFTITEVKAILGGLTGTTYTPVVTLHADEMGDPADAVLTTFTNPDPLPTLANSFATLTFTSSSGYTVDPSATYHLRFADAVTSATAVEFYFVRTVIRRDEDALTDPDDTMSGTGWGIDSKGRQRIGGTSGTWAEVGQGPFRIGISGTIATPGVTIDADPDASGVQNPEHTDNYFELDEGGASEMYTVVLDANPGRDVTITPSPGPGLAVTPTFLTFTAENWNAKQTFTVSAPQDANAVDEEDLEITHTVSGYGEITTAGTVHATVFDDDKAEIEFRPPSVPVNEGAMATYTVVLVYEPTSDVTVTPVGPPGTTGVVVATTPLVFTPTNWNVQQTVTVTAGEDTNKTNETATITHTVSQNQRGVFGIRRSGTRHSTMLW